MIGQQIEVRYNPGKPQISILLKHKSRGELPGKDKRFSLWAWFENLYGK